jgi:TATA-binding protein-associated factor Taf7
MAKTVNAAASATDVVIAKGTLTISEPVKLPKIKITATDNAYITAAKDYTIKNVKIEIGGSTYDMETTDGATWTTVDSDIYVSKTSDIRILVNVDALANSNDTISFGLLNGQSFVGNGTYDNSDEPLTLSDVA